MRRPVVPRPDRNGLSPAHLPFPRALEKWPGVADATCCGRPPNRPCARWRRPRRGVDPLRRVASRSRPSPHRTGLGEHDAAQRRWPCRRCARSGGQAPTALETAGANNPATGLIGHAVPESVTLRAPTDVRLERALHLVPPRPPSLLRPAALHSCVARDRWIRWSVISHGELRWGNPVASRSVRETIGRGEHRHPQVPGTRLEVGGHDRQPERRGSHGRPAVHGEIGPVPRANEVTCSTKAGWVRDHRIACAVARVRW